MFSVSPQKSLAEAESFANDLLRHFDTKAPFSNRVAGSFCVERPLTKGDGHYDRDTLMYVFNLYEDGFVIVSADNRDFPLIAYVEKGHVDESLTTGLLRSMTI